MRSIKPWVDGIFRVRGTTGSRHNLVRLDKNERTTLFPEKFFNQVISKIRHEHLTAYPETEPFYELLAEYLGLDKQQIVIVSGSDSGIRNCFELAVDRGSEVITISPTFAMVDVYAQLYGAKQIKIGYTQDLSLQWELLLDSISSDVSLIVIANPNSPTGTIIPGEVIDSIVSKARGHDVMVLVDEAYYEFSRETAFPLISKYDNLVVVRTLSKGFGLAGCRIGYMVAQRELAQRLYRFRPMYEVSAFSILAATELLNNYDVVSEYLKKTEAGRAFLRNSLNELGYGHIDTKTNFIHIDFGSERDEYEKAFLRSGILVRGGPGVPGYEGYLRVSLGPIDSMKYVTDFLKAKRGH